MLAAVVLAATTEARALLAGLERLRLPAVLVAILSFMLRYVVVTADELRRVRDRTGGTGWVGPRHGPARRRDRRGRHPVRAHL